MSRDSIFERQGLHFLLFAVLFTAVGLISGAEGLLVGSWQGIPTAYWFWLSILVPVVHQVWVWLCWRMELHHQWLSRHLGTWGFRIYAIGFALLFLARFYTLIATAIGSAGSLTLDRGLLWVLAVIVTIPVLYTFYSVARYFGFRRALGIDHFDPSYRNRLFVRAGIFRWTRNGMYTFGMAFVWLPGLVWASTPALVSAAFSHLYIWVHYLCTELPDMRRIYGTAKVDGEADLAATVGKGD